MDYFYCPPEKISRQSILIDNEEFAHLVHVMRKKVGDVIRVVDGRGNAYEVRLDEIKKRVAVGSIQAFFRNYHEPAINVTLAVGVLKNPSKFDFLVEKVTELGAREIVPLSTARTIPSHAKIERWQKLVLAAMKQCGRSYLPPVRELISLDKFLAARKRMDLKLIAHEKADDSPPVRMLLTPVVHSIVILIGPEGGFSDDEVAQCFEAGYKPLYLGERRLRTETAAIVATTIMMMTSSSNAQAR
jgi:16S rRNA (uracil1498-N3)-methyltransferase